MFTVNGAADVLWLDSLSSLGTALLTKERNVSNVWRQLKHRVPSRNFAHPPLSRQDLSTVPDIIILDKFRFQISFRGFPLPLEMFPTCPLFTGAQVSCSGDEIQTPHCKTVSAKQDLIILTESDLVVYKEISILAVENSIICIIMTLSDFSRAWRLVNKR